MTAIENKKTGLYSKGAAVFFLVLTGVVSLFADMNYEGGRSVVGQYLKLLGSSALALGMAAGLGEFVGYAFRLISGALADRTRKYWWFIIGGYIIQLSALPAIAFVSGWELAIVFLFLERLGKAVRKPAHDAMISFAAKQTGSGFGFGLQEAMDQIGAFIGPVLFSSLLFSAQGSPSLEVYKTGLLWLFVPAGLAVAICVVARFRFPHPEKFEIPNKTPQLAIAGFPVVFWLISGAAALLAMGITDFPLVGLHLTKTGTFLEAAIPLLYAGAMAVDAAAAMVVGYLYDRFGLKALAVLFVVEIGTAPLLFLAPLPGILVGMALWGISVGTQESILKAAIGDRVSEDRRARAYGVFHTLFGAAWFVGSVIIGALYDGLGAWPMVAFSLLAQSAAAVLFFVAIKKEKAQNNAQVQ